MQNPYTPLFGKIPTQIIPRTKQAALIVDSFTDKNPNQKVFVVTGVRGSGKTVFMTDVSQTLSRDEEWVIEELSVEQDLLESLVARLNSRRTPAKVFAEDEIDLSLYGLGLRIQGSQPIANIEVALERMLQALAKKANVCSPLWTRW
ncbi:MAG: hypothetical protein IKG21_12730 [Atopobiaceae bacterium]|nr:hypothetical protein [Atopobiaceae bacterium]